MKKILKRLVDYFIERRRIKLEKNFEKLKNTASYVSSTSKVHIDGASTLTLTSETEKNLEILNEKLKNIVKTFSNNPEQMLNFVKEQGTVVYRFALAQKVLNVISEEEGFITPLKGIKAFWLNFAVGLLQEKKIVFRFKSEPMFVLRNGDLNVYFMLHQLHKWYSFRANLPGYDYLAQSLFKENLETMTESDVKEMSIEEILALKEAIARDSEAADFVIQLAKESSGAKKALDKMQNDGGAQI